jgi:iron complex transport system substrate-binding protein
VHRLAILLTALITSAAPAAAGGEKPARIMSMNLCTDALLLDLVEPRRITSVTPLSRSRSNSYRWPQATQVPINHGLAEEVLQQRPDLVLAGTYTTTATRAVLKRLGMPLLEVPPANNFAEIRQVTRSVAEAVGEQERGERLLAEMDATLAALAATRPKQIIRVAGWDGGGSVPGEGTLFDAILRAAGGTNIAALPGSQGSSFGIERLLLSRPDILAYGADNHGTHSLRTDTDQHPLILALYGKRRITYPELLYGCGVPESADAAQALQTAMLEAMRAPGP